MARASGGNKRVVSPANMRSEKRKESVLPVERRRSALRRDLNDMVRDPTGGLSEAKLWASLGKAIAAYLLMSNATYIIAYWDALAILLLIMVAPDLIKKVLNLKYQQGVSK